MYATYELVRLELSKTYGDVTWVAACGGDMFLLLRPLSYALLTSYSIIFCNLHASLPLSRTSFWCSRVCDSHPCTSSKSQNASKGTSWTIFEFVRLSETNGESRRGRFIIYRVGADTMEELRLEHGFYHKFLIQVFFPH